MGVREWLAVCVAHVATFESFLCILHRTRLYYIHTKERRMVAVCSRSCTISIRSLFCHNVQIILLCTGTNECVVEFLHKEKTFSPCIFHLFKYCATQPNLASNSVYHHENKWLNKFIYLHSKRAGALYEAIYKPIVPFLFVIKTNGISSIIYCVYVVQVIKIL